MFFRLYQLPDKVGDYSKTLKSGILDRIQSSMSGDIEAMNQIIGSALATEHELVDKIIANYIAVKGKQIRPILVILAARMFGEVNDAVLHSAAALEMLHNATLIHDDVVDQTPLRRGQPTVNAVWGNHLAVLSGDIFVSKALSTGIKTGSLPILATLSELGTQLSLGEMDQLFTARAHVLNREAYFRIIELKTASLFVGCVRIGAQAAGAADSEFEPLERFARLLGLAFQIRDDIFDYFPSDEIGKPSGHDLLEGKVTLPILCALEKCKSEEAVAVRKLLESDEMLSPEEIRRIQEFAIQNGGISMAEAEMERLFEEGKKILDVYSDSPAKRDFADIFEFIIRRSK